MTHVHIENGTLGLTNGSFNFSDLEDEHEEDYIFFRTEVKTTFILAYTFVFVCCFVGNLLVILVVLVHRRMRSMTNFFLANLAFANLCVGVFCIYQNLSQYLIASWVWGEFLCKMYHFIETLSYTASIAILTLLAVERYLAIIHPLRNKLIMTQGRLKVTIGVVWLVSAAYASPRLLMYGVVTYPSKNASGSPDTICLLQRALYDTKVYDSVTFVVCFLLPLSIITVMYVRIAVELWKGFGHVTCRYTPSPIAREMVTLRDQDDSSDSSNKKIETTTLTGCEDGTSNNVSKAAKTSSVKILVNADRKDSSAGSSSSQNSSHLQTPPPPPPPLNRNNSWMSDSGQVNLGNGALPAVAQGMKLSESVIRGRRKVIRMLIAVVLSFAACNLPIHARKLWQYWSPSYDALSDVASLLTPITFLIMYLNTAINPILYAFLSRNFRKSMKDVMVCKFYRTRHSRNMSSTRSVRTQVTTCPTDC